MQFSKVVLGSALAAAVLSGCQVVDPDSKKVIKSNDITVVDPDSKEVIVGSKKAIKQIFEVDHDGRMYQFYDFATYQSFLDVGETAYRLTRIGGGPKGETLVFGLAKADKKKGAKTPAAMLWDGKVEASKDFYGEIRKHGRIYVFNNKADMDAVRQVGEPSYMFTEIGGGPKGETVVYVLNKSNKKKRPDALIAKFKTLNPVVQMAAAEPVAEAAPEVAEPVIVKTTEIFDVIHDGRYYSFYDYATYQSFLSVGETAYRLTRIGGGPKGETLVFGLAKADKKKGDNTPAALLWDGKSEVEGNFYAELRKHGRIYVFNKKADLDAVRQVGEPSYMYTQIGAGANGETLVFVLNKDNKKKKPVELMEKYQAVNAK